jgi:hypothetical protein
VQIGADLVLAIRKHKVYWWRLLGCGGGAFCYGAVATGSIMLMVQILEYVSNLLNLNNFISLCLVSSV